ncbi:metallophosphoesterase family protein [Clostridium beijerinckii]|uniref:metallophosphoesterase family protein n=1 Tax=Clostridium beijerinckii TaxID=1520 RepID=UPI00031444AB|nr:metallophosphoesterase [Clostridium beijerinckii]
MGYRISIKDINSIAILIDGNIKSFMEETLESIESLHRNISNIKDILKNFDTNFYSSRVEYYINKRNDINHYSELLEDLELEYCVEIFRNNNKSLENIGDNKDISLFRRILEGVSSILGKTRIKAIIVPGFEDNEINQILRSKQILKELIGFHPGESCIILQVIDEITKDYIYLYNSFKNFGVALKNVDEWPGVLLWDKEDSVFIPISNIDELKEIFRSICDRDSLASIEELKDKYSDKKEEYAYFIHLSDLHLGDDHCNKTQKRLLNIVKNQIREINSNKNVHTIITGDLMNNPNLENKKLVDKFLNDLINEANIKNEPIYVLGNHDLYQKGLSAPGVKPSNIMQQNEFITRIDEIKVIFIKFNSNNSGIFAQGNIGEEQLMQIGNILDDIENKNDYTLIGLLHHHPLIMDYPSWYRKDMVETVLGEDGHQWTMQLLNSNLFLDWISQRNIKVILHGHKHIPKIKRYKKSFVIACGSSTGKVINKDKKKTYISYNVIKYDINRKLPVSCVLYFEDNLGAGPQQLEARSLL